MEFSNFRYYLTVGNICLAAFLAVVAVHIGYCYFKARNKIRIHLIRYVLILSILLLLQYFPKVSADSNEVVIYCSYGRIEDSVFANDFNHSLEQFGLSLNQVKSEDSVPYSSWAYYNPFIRQYNVDSMLSHIQLHTSNSGGFHLIITDKDLYSPGMNWTSGGSVGKVMAVSCCRLDPDYWKESEAGKTDDNDLQIFQSRILKVSLHELGHSLGIDLHCANENCVMQDSDSIEEIDKLGTEYCRICIHEISKALSPK